MNCCFRLFFFFRGWDLVLGAGQQQSVWGSPFWSPSNTIKVQQSNTVIHQHRSLLAPGPDKCNPHYPGLPWLETLPGATSEVETLYFHATGVPVGSSFWDGRGAGSESWEPRTDRTAKQYIKNQNFSNLNSHFTMLPLSSTRFLTSRIGGVLQRKGPQTWGDGCQPAGYSYVLVHLALARLSDSHMTRRGGDGGEWKGRIAGRLVENCWNEVWEVAG